MPRHPFKHWDEIVVKYQTGEYGVTELANMYRLNKSNVSRYLKANNIQVNENARAAISQISSGLSHLSEIVENENKATEKQRTNADIVEILENENENKATKSNTQLNFSHPTLSAEVLEIVRDRNPQFARALQGLSAKIINRTNELLNKPLITSSDVNNLANAMAKVNDTMGVIPKAPSIAIQNNLQQNATFSQKKTPKINITAKVLKVE